MIARNYFEHRGDIYLAIPAWDVGAVPDGYERVHELEALRLSLGEPRPADPGARVKLFRRRLSTTLHGRAEPRAEVEHDDADLVNDTIAIQLIGGDDRGISGITCKIILPDGRAIMQPTDADGWVRLKGIPSGQCIVGFPDLDAKTWEPV
jgi:hypothetical protein